jgi:uncharacterized protein YaeQ
MPKCTAAEVELDNRVREAEKQIQEILLDLVNEHGAKIEWMEVDTRRFANLSVNIVAHPST